MSKSPRFVIDAAGNVAYQGAFDDNLTTPSKHYVTDAVSALLAGKKPEVTQTKPFGCAIRPAR